MAHILIVEDNELNRDMLSRRLERRGFDVSIAVDGQEGLNMIKSERPDLVLMDMDLPIIDGWEATRQAKSDGDISAIPIIALTAHALAEHREQAEEAGANDFDTKPIEMPRLLEKIEKLLP
jgi:two-component system cell cycle response regulator DivK